MQSYEIFIFLQKNMHNSYPIVFLSGKMKVKKLKEYQHKSDRKYQRINLT